MTVPLSRRGSLASANRSQTIYIFARDYPTAGEIARIYGLGRLRWQFVVSHGTLLGRRNIRLWTYTHRLQEHANYRSVSGSIAAFRAGEELVEDRIITWEEAKETRNARDARA